MEIRPHNDALGNPMFDESASASWRMADEEFGVASVGVHSISGARFGRETSLGTFF